MKAYLVTIRDFGRKDIFAQEYDNEAAAVDAAARTWKHGAVNVASIIVTDPEGRTIVAFGVGAKVGGQLL